MSPKPDVILEWIRGELASGKFLVLPQLLYKEAIKICRDAGWTEVELANIYESKPLASMSYKPL